MNNIILIGMPGCGKSTIGVLLAKICGYSFLDCDLLIQSKTGKKLFEIIDSEGAEGFLKIENDVLKNINCENTIIATGGSAVYCDEAMEHLKTIGKVVYIKVSPNEVKKRITNFSTRGIVMKKASDLYELYFERLPLYEKYADITVEPKSDDLSQNALLIAKILKV